MTPLNAAGRRFLENASLIGALRVIFGRLSSLPIPIRPLGEVAETTSGGTPDRTNLSYYGGPFPWLKSGELNDGLVTDIEESLSEDGLANSNAKVIPKGTLLIALYGATVGKTGILGVSAATNQAVCAITPKTPELRTSYLYWFLRHKRADFLRSSFGGAQPNISQRILRDTLVPIASPSIQDNIAAFLSAVEQRMHGTKIELPNLVPPLAEQRQVVLRIETLALTIDEARLLRQQAATEAAALISAAQTEAYRGSLQISGKTERLEELCTRITDGTHITPHYVDDGIPFVSVKDITGGKICLESSRRISREEHAQLVKRCKPERGDILLTKIGTIGYAKVVDIDEEFSIFVSLALLKPNMDRVLPQFIEHMLNSTIIRDQALADTRGVGNQNLVLKFIKEFKLPVPPMPEQLRIVAELDALKSQVDALKRLQAETSAELNALLPSMLSKGFAGNL